MPKSLEEGGYTPTSVSQRIASEMSRIASGQRSISSEIVSDDAAVFQRQIVGSSDLPDIQVPGQQFSLRTVLRFVKNVVGLGDPAVSIGISRDGDRMTSDVLVTGGPYDGARERFTAIKISMDDFLRSTAARAVAAAQPLSYAAYLAASDPRQCPALIDCSFNEAERVLTRILVDAPELDNASAHLGLSAMFIRRGEYAESWRHCEAALALDSSLRWSYIYCAYARNGMHERDDAVGYVMKAVQAGSNDPDLHAGLGDVLMRLGRMDDAAIQFRTATELDPRHAYSYIGIGTLARRRGDLQEASAAYERALFINPAEPYAHGGLGIVLVALKRYDEAIPHLERALTFDPSLEAAADAWSTAHAKIASGD